MESNYWADFEADWIETDPLWVEEVLAHDAGGGYLQIPMQRVPFHMEPSFKVTRVPVSAVSRSTGVCYGSITGRASIRMSVVSSSSMRAVLSHNEKHYKNYRRHKDEEAVVQLVLV